MSGYYRREAGGVDGEEGDAIDFGSENSELGVEGGEREAAVTGRELMRLVLVVIEWVLGWECYSKCEPIGSLDLGVTTRLVQPICVVCIKCLHHHHQQQQHCQHCHCYCHWINAYQLTLLFHTFLSWLFLAVMLLMESGVNYKDTVLCCVVWEIVKYTLYLKNGTEYIHIHLLCWERCELCQTGIMSYNYHWIFKLFLKILKKKFPTNNIKINMNYFKLKWMRKISNSEDFGRFYISKPSRFFYIISKS